MQQATAHVDEGTVHAWLDGALDPAEAAPVEAHVAACEACAAVVAEARGLIAGATRILIALDDVPGDVVPRTAAPLAASAARPDVRSIAAARRRRLGVPLRAAAAVVLMAGAAGVVLSRRAPERAVPMTASAPSEPSAGADVAAGSADVATSSAAPAMAAPAAPAPPPATAPMLAPRPAQTGAPVAKAAPLAAVPSAARAEERAAPAAQTDANATREQRIAAAPDGRPNALRGAASAPERVAAGKATDALGSLAASGVVAGLVTDERNVPLPAAAVQVARTPLGAASDSAGRFVLRDVPAGPTTVVVQRIGFAPGSTVVDVRPADTTRVAVSLAGTVRALSEVAVQGGRAAPAAQRAPSAPPAASGAVPGCYTLQSDVPHALPSPLRLAPGGAGDRVRWTLATDGVLRVAPADSAVVLALRPAGTGWAGTLTTRAPARSGDAMLVRRPDCEPR